MKKESENRKDWSIIMQENFAVPIYKHYWNISGDDLIEIDDYADSEEVAKRVDMSGIDKMVQPTTGVRHIAQRFRTLSQLDDGTVLDPDFSIRVGTYGGYETEYDKLLNAHQNNGNIPQIYAFGICNAITREKALEKGFKEYYFIKLPQFLKALDNGHIEAVASYDNDDGSKGLYFSIEDMRKNNTIQDTISGDVLSSVWSKFETSSDFPTAPGVKTTGQVNLLDFTKGEK